MAAATALAGDAVLEKRMFAPPRNAATEAKVQKKPAGWFDLPEPEMTPELKRDLQLLKLRGTWDPKRFYKSNDTTKLPKHFAIGTVVEGAAEFFSARVNRKDRHQSITGEVRPSSTQPPPFPPHTARSPRRGALQQRGERSPTSPAQRRPA
jgi:hypothetical protein